MTDAHEPFPPISPIPIRELPYWWTDPGIGPSELVERVIERLHGTLKERPHDPFWTAARVAGEAFRIGEVGLIRFTESDRQIDVPTYAPPIHAIDQLELELWAAVEDGEDRRHSLSRCFRILRGFGLAMASHTGIRFRTCPSVYLRRWLTD